MAGIMPEPGDVGKCRVDRRALLLARLAALLDPRIDFAKRHVEVFERDLQRPVLPRAAWPIFSFSVEIA